MPKRKRPELAAEARRLNLEQLARAGAELRSSRERRRLTQEQVARRAGISRPTESAIERGFGGSHTLDTWQRLALAIDRPLRIEFGRDRLEETADAGHLAMQELVLRLGRSAGFRGGFELATKPTDPSRSADVGLRDDRRRLLLLVECWNSIGDIGVAARSTNRKLAEGEQLAVVLGGERPHRVAGCWVVRASRRNRDLVARYPEVFAARFQGSSVGWVLALTAGRNPPEEPGLVWCDVASTRVFAWRHSIPPAVISERVGPNTIHR
jgi:transcriptional regulator with XRE-family HTH domain